MKNRICTFFGHRDAPPEIKTVLREVLVDLIENHGVRQFYVGNHGNFDAAARSLLAEFECTHAIQYDVVLAYVPDHTDPFFETYHTILPEGIETVPRRFAIDHRNRWLAEHCDIAITYVVSPAGGAAKFRELARRKNKTIIELS